MKESDKEVRIWRSLVGAGLRKMRKKKLDFERIRFEEE